MSARRERVSSFVGAGCLIQGLGLLAPFVGYGLAGSAGALVGLVLLVILFVVGSSKAVSYRCGNCKNPIASKAVNLCPVCRETLE